MFWDSALFIMSGMSVTLTLLVGSLILGLALGVIFAIFRYNYAGTCFVIFINRVISVIRGTPLILQLSFVYFTLPSAIGLKLDIVATGILTFGINSSAYIAEILRAGVESIAKEQFEVCKTLKISRYYMWKDIILPQVLRNILPTLIGEIISLTKDTSIIATIGAMDIMRSAQIVAASQFTYFMPLCIAGAYYYMLILAIEYCGKLLERSMSYAKNH